MEEDVRLARQLQEAGGPLGEAGHDVRSHLHPGLCHYSLEGTFEMASRDCLH